MKDYYAVLGVQPGADKKTIRRAYRAKAKEVHPDASGESGTARFLVLKEAYEVLSHRSTREAYDETYRAAKKGEAESKWDYREFLQGHRDDPENLAKLICYDLLHDYDVEAVELYEDATAGGVFSLRRWLDREDFMDFTFLLAEAYRERGSLVKAWRLLRGIAALEEDDPYFKHFYAEVLEQLGSIVRHTLPDDPEDELRLAFLKDLLSLSYPNREKAKFSKSISEIYAKREDYSAAAEYLYAARDLNPKLPGVAETIAVLESAGP